MKNIVVFGGSGFIGLNFIHNLIINKKFEHIYSVDIQDPLENYRKKKYEKLKENKKIIFIQKDIRESLVNLDIKDVDLIIDLAAIHKEPGHNEIEYFQTNVNGSKNICEFAKNVNCKNIIFTSSISVYGPGDHEKNENTQTIPNTAYGKSKLEAEKNYINWQNHNEKENILTICRPGVVFGPGENGNVTRLIKAVQKKLFFYMGNKYLKKSGIYIDELINAITWINDNQINNKFEKIILFNGSFNPCPNLKDYVSAISKEFGYNNTFISFPKSLIKIIIFFSSIITKNISPKSNYNYVRLNKLFRSNFVTPQFLINSKYKFKYTLNNSMKNWKETNFKDWEN